MGVDAADFDQDGWIDLFVTNLDHEIFSLYHNAHDGSLTRSQHLGIGNATQLMSGWGLKFLDYDNDGNLDLFLANGHPDDLVEDFSSQVKYREPLLLSGTWAANFRMSVPTAGRFSASRSRLGEWRLGISTTMAIDVLIAVNDGAPVLLRNNVGASNHWLGVKLVGKKCNADAVGALITYQAGI